MTYSSKNSFTLTITDVTTGKSFSANQKCPSAARSSAEWIMEAPSSRSGVLPLANFGAVTFSGCQVALNRGSLSTAERACAGHRQGDIFRQGEGINVKLTNGGFNVTWKSP